MQSMIILALCLIVAVSAQNYGCSVPQGPCMALNGMNICPNNQGCVDNNSVCCNYGDIINKDQPAATTPAPVPNCVDKINPNTGVSDCPSMASYCTYGPYVALMQDQCPKTCHYC